jgi:hypothetical protein
LLAVHHRVAMGNGLAASAFRSLSLCGLLGDLLENLLGMVMILLMNLSLMRELLDKSTKPFILLIVVEI